MNALFEVLFPYIALFYVLDCFVHIKRFHLGFSSQVGLSFAIKGPGLRFIGLSPLAQLFYSVHFPHFRGERGVYLWRKREFNAQDLYEAANFVFVEFDKLAEVAHEGEKLVLDDSLTLDLGDEGLARRVAGWLRQLEPPGAGVTLLDAPVPELAGRLRAHRHLFHRARLAGLALFVAVFLLLPAALYLPLDLRLETVVALIVLCYLLALGTALHAQSGIDRREGKLLKLFFVLLFSPVDAMHTLHMLTRNLAVGVDWLELAAGLLPAARFREVLRRELKRVMLSREKCGDGEVKAYLSRKLMQYKHLMDEAGLTEAELLSPPCRCDAAACLYCPHCETEYVNDLECCPECGVRLRRHAEQG